MIRETKKKKKRGGRGRRNESREFESDNEKEPRVWRRRQRGAREHRSGGFVSRGGDRAPRYFGVFLSAGHMHSDVVKNEFFSHRFRNNWRAK